MKSLGINEHTPTFIRDLRVYTYMIYISTLETKFKFSLQKAILCAFINFENFASLHVYTILHGYSES